MIEEDARVRDPKLTTAESLASDGFEERDPALCEQEALGRGHAVSVANSGGDDPLAFGTAIGGGSDDEGRFDLLDHDIDSPLEGHGRQAEETP